MKPERRIVTLREFLQMLAPVGAILVALLLARILPNTYPPDYQYTVYPAFLDLCLGCYLFFLLPACFIPRFRAKLLHLSWLLMTAFLLLEALDIATLKTGYFELPFIPSPDQILDSIPINYSRLAVSLFYSLQLLLTGLLTGIIGGLLTGILMGWSKICNYWFMPLLKIIGPVPSAAWLPIAMVVFPTSHLASIFLIFLSIWFPLTLMVSSAIRDTDKHLIETARVLGANDLHILLHVAVPSAIPAMFNGIFMGLGLSFTALIVAEMLGVKAGLGWYITWAQSWGEYAKIYSTVGIFSVIFFILIDLLFRIRDRLLRWQKGNMRW